MEIEITVFNPDRDKETSFGDFQFNHSGCGKITQRRNKINSDSELRCGCGLEITLEQLGIAKEQIIKSVIDGQPCILIEGNYSSIPLATIKIVPKDNA